MMMQHRTRSSNEKRSWPQVAKFAGAQCYHRFWQQKDSTWRTEAISIHHGNNGSTMTSVIRYQFGRSLWRRVDLATKRRLVAHDDAASCSNKRQSTFNQTALAIVWAKAVLMTMDWDPLEMTWIQNESANWNISMNWSLLSGLKITSFLDKGRFHIIVSQRIFGASLWSEASVWPRLRIEQWPIWVLLEVPSLTMESLRVRNPLWRTHTCQGRHIGNSGHWCRDCTADKVPA